MIARIIAVFLTCISASSCVCRPLGCAQIHHRHLSRSQAAEAGEVLVFGYVDMKDAPTRLDYAELKQVSPVIKYPFWYTYADHGLFYLGALPVGSYRLTEFGGYRAIDTGPIYLSLPGYDGTYKLPEFGDEGMMLRFGAPGLYYLGSWKYVSDHIPRCLFLCFPPVGGYSLKHIEHPDERELLEELLPHTTGTKWEPIVKARLKGLSQ